MAGEQSRDLAGQYVSLHVPCRRHTYNLLHFVADTLRLGRIRGENLGCHRKRAVETLE